MPDWLKYVRERLPLTGCPPEREAQIVEELAEQLEEAYQEALRLGVSDEDACSAARQHVSDWAKLADDLKRAGFRPIRRSVAVSDSNVRVPTLSNAILSDASDSPPAEKVALRTCAATILTNAAQDLHFALRMLRKNPGFAFMAVLTLAIGIGANTAIFSFVNAVLLRPLPYPNADRLAIILSGQGNANRAPVSTFELFHIREQAKEFDQIAGIWVTNAALPGEGDAEQGKRGVVTSNFLQLLCAKPELGRFFNRQDEDRQQGGKHARPIIISHALWVRRFGSDPAIIGKSAKMGRGSATVIGVLPANFRFIFPNDASVPANVDFFDTIPIDGSDPGGPGFLHLVGRLRNGSTLTRAQAEADAVAARVRSLNSEIALTNFRLYVFSLHTDGVREVRTTLLLLFGGVGFVLLIACANVANLVMTRAMHRMRETTIRAALGASPERLVRQLLTESLLLGCLGGFSALLIGWAAVRAILAARPPSLAIFGAVHLDLRVFAFTFVVAISASVLFGLAPAASVRHLDLIRDLKDATRSVAGTRYGWASFLISAEVALAFALLLGTGLLMRTFINILHADPGFRADDVSTFRITAPNYQTLQQLQKNLTALPQVQSVSAVSHLPLDDAGNWYDYYWKEGAPADQQSTVMADHRSILPGYFATIGATLLEGRDFHESDDASRQRVAIVDDVLARELWPQGNAIGSKLNISDSPTGFYQFQRDWAVVVGVVRHIQCHSLTAIVRPQIYVPYQIAPRPSMSIVIRTDGTVQDLPAIARQQVADVNRDIAITQLEPLNNVVMRAQAESRFASLLASLLSAIALLLACVGIYGVLSYSVAQRRSEIGVRMAIGAGRAEVLKMVLIDGLAPVLAGLVAGLLLSLIVTRVLARLLFGVKPGDPVNYLLILFILAVVSTLAALLPARRAMKVDPLTALRCE